MNDELKEIRERHETKNRNFSGKIIFSEELHLADKDRGELLKMVDKLLRLDNVIQSSQSIRIARAGEQAMREENDGLLKCIREQKKQLDAVRKLQRYDGKPFGHTGNNVQYFKSDDGGIVLWRDVQATLNGEDDE